jgi:hypothetical protein
VVEGLITERRVEWFAFLLYIHEAPFSNIGSETGYIEISRVSLSPSR